MHRHFESTKNIEASNNPNRGEGNNDFTRALFEQNRERQRASSSYCSEASDQYRAQDVQRGQNASSSHAPEAPYEQRIQQRKQDVLQRPEIFPHLASVLPSREIIGLENGIRVSARDICSVESLRDCCDSEYHCKEAKALVELRSKCEDSEYQLSEQSCKLLVEYKLIDQNANQPSQSVRDIVLYLSQKGCLGYPEEKIVQRVKLKNGTDVDLTLTRKIMRDLTNVMRDNPQAISELYELCNTPNYVLKNAAIAQVLKLRGLIDEHTGQPSESVKNIVCCSVNKKSSKLDDPRMESSELVERTKEKIFQAVNRGMSLLKEHICELAHYNKDCQKAEQRLESLEKEQQLEVRKKLEEELRIAEIDFLKKAVSIMQMMSAAEQLLGAEWQSQESALSFSYPYQPSYSGIYYGVAMLYPPL